MGLDVYVGPLSRYYSGQWETVIQQWGRAAGIPVSLSRIEDRRPETDQVRRAVDAWRSRIRRKVDSARHDPGTRSPFHQWRKLFAKKSDSLPAQSLDWDESETAPHFTDKPDWDGYTGLLLLAAYVEHPDLERPKYLPDEVGQDPAWRASAAQGFRHSRYRQILQPTLWLPDDFDVTINAQDLVGKRVCIGSSVVLLAQLRDLNENTLRGTARHLAQWRRAGAEPGDTFAKQARFGLAVFLDLAEKAVAHRLPMKLDY